MKPIIYEDDDDMMKVDQAITLLDNRKHRLLCVLYYKANYSNADCAKRLKIHRNTIPVWIDKIHDQLHKTLG